MLRTGIGILTPSHKPPGRLAVSRHFAARCPRTELTSLRSTDSSQSSAQISTNGDPQQAPLLHRWKNQTQTARQQDLKRNYPCIEHINRILGGNYKMSVRHVRAKSSIPHFVGFWFGSIPTPCRSRPDGVTYLAFVTATALPFSSGWTF